MGLDAKIGGHPRENHLFDPAFVDHISQTQLDGSSGFDTPCRSSERDAEASKRPAEASEIAFRRPVLKHGGVERPSGPAGRFQAPAERGLQPAKWPPAARRLPTLDATTYPATTYRPPFEFLPRLQTGHSKLETPHSKSRMARTRFRSRHS